MTGNRARPLNGHAKPVRGRRPAYLEPDTGLDPREAFRRRKGANVHYLTVSQVNSILPVALLALATIFSIDVSSWLLRPCVA